MLKTYTFSFLFFVFMLLALPIAVLSQSRDITTTQEVEDKVKKEKEDKVYKPTKQKGLEHYWNGNFRAALDEFLLLLAADPQNVDYNFYVGCCYLETNIDKSKAISYLEFVTQQPKYDKEALYQLGRAYHFAHRFDEAIITYNKYKDILRGTNDNIIAGDRMIEMCFNAKELVKYPLDVTFENMGSRINTPYPEYNPFIPEDESFLVFTSKRPDCLGIQIDYDGYKTSDIYRSNERRGKFGEARNIGSSVNTEWYEEVVGVSADGEEMLVYIDNFDGYDDVYASLRKGRYYEEYKSLGPNVNSEGIETSAGMSTDGTKLFFSREDKTTKGGTDIYMSRRLPNGGWGESVNLGDVINTKYNETFPHLAADGKTLYFASEGHVSMGGFDIFTSVWDELTQTWSTPKNLGYPINTVDEDYNISMSTTGRYGYTSQFREEGFGERDIYRVTFNDVEAEKSLVRGSITNIADTLKINPNYKFPEFIMSVTSMETNELIGYYKPNSRSSNYVQILPPGEYCVYIQNPLYFDTMGVVEVLGQSSYISEIIQDYTMRPDPNAIWGDKTTYPLEFPKVEEQNLTLADEIMELEKELEKLEVIKKLGYDPSLMDVDITNTKKFKPGDKIILERIYFDFDKDLIREESVIELSKLYYFMTSNPDMIVEVAGHTDSRGTDEYNIDLSKRRAKSVQAWLVERGIKAKRVATKGYGEAKPIADNLKPDGSDDPDGRQMNRRIELTVLSVDGKKIITTEGK
jgi:outer membrane protein OmpA-like peptidoglycan-associated protein/tetratricopeptide (TPR) repeat protein